MKLTIEVEDRYVSRFMRLLSNLRYVRLKARTMDVAEAAPEKPEHSAATSDDSTPAETAPFQFTRVSGKWDEPDFDFAEFRRNAWGRNL